MKKSTQRPSASQLQAIAAKADRKAAAAERRQDDYRVDPGYSKMYN